MSLISIYVDEKDAPRVNARAFSDGRRYITAHVGGVYVSLPGFDADCVTYTRALASALMTAATEIECALVDDQRAAQEVAS